MTQRPDTRDHYLIAEEVLTGLDTTVFAARISRGLSQQAAAGEIGIARTSLARLETGRDARMSTVIKVLEWIRQHR